MTQQSSRPLATNRAQVLVRAFGPSTNPNVGGILQVWALQQALASLGFDAWIYDPPIRFRERVKDIASALIATVRPHDKRTSRAARRSANRELLGFAEGHLATAKHLSRRGDRDLRTSVQFEAFITGSDQVWRPDYADVEANLFGSLPDSYTGPRIAYAASFGRDSLAGYTKALQARTLPMARRLTAVSVRETSAIALCRELWGIDALQTVDPTLLLDRAAYESLAAVAPPSVALLVDYVLDSNDMTRLVLSELAQWLGTRSRSLSPTAPISQAGFNSEPMLYTKPTVQEWLRAYSSAGFIVTDSFHGTVFAILFQRPFIVVQNHERGVARFQSLLEMLDLNDRVFDGTTSAASLIQRPIDWSQVNRLLATQREASYSFLRQALASDD